MSESEPRVLTATRRNFLKGALGLSAAVLLGDWETLDHHDEQTDSAENNHDSTPREAHHNSLVAPVEALDTHLQKDQGYGATAVDGVAAFGATAAYAAVANNRHVRLYSGNSSSPELLKKYKENKLKTLGFAIVGAPIAEEAIFRGLPGLFTRRGSIAPIRGILSTYAFGKMHQVATPTDKEIVEGYLQGDTKPKFGFDKNKIPVPQYALGGFLWMIARRRSLTHAMVTHAAFNGSAFSILDASLRFEKKDDGAKAAADSVGETELQA